MMHTSGEWKVDGIPGYDAPMIYGSGRPIAKVLYHEGSEDREVDANARLIAAAPKLLAACQAFVTAWEKCLQLEKTDVALRLAKIAIEEVAGE